MNNKGPVVPPITLSKPAMAHITIDHIQDARLLVIPSMRRIPTPKEMASFVTRLAPIEMAAPSLTSPPTLPLSTPRGVLVLPLHNNNSDPTKASASQPLSTAAVGQSIQGWTIPLAYVACGLGLCLCNILVPDGIVGCLHILCPIWTLTLALHALATNDPVWLWLGALTGMLLPFVLLLRDLLFVCFYLLVFAVFGSGRFWQTLQGPPLVLVCVSWLGLLSGCVLAVLAEHPRAQLSVAAFFALASAIVSSGARFGKLVLRVG
jgi:hypothetical protein